MSIQVNDFQWEPGKNDAEYIKLLKSSRDEWQKIAQKAIAKLKTLSRAQEAQGWVSVKDRLPEVDNPVIVYARGKNDSIYKIVIASMTNKNVFDTRLETEPYWREPWQFFDTMYEITHWMPLPEPPKEENDGRNED